MLVFLDTEFTDFVQMELISLALVGEDGQEFYAERTDYDSADCSQFVLDAVVPVLGRVPGAECSRAQLTRPLQAWFDGLPEPATLIFDYVSDWELLADALRGDADAGMPENLGERLLLGDEIVGSRVFQDAAFKEFSAEWPRHHSLADARALRAGYKAWKEAAGS